MRNDTAKVVTERPRRGHGTPSKKWGRRLGKRRLGKNEHDADDHGPTRAPIARHHQYGWNAKEFSDVLGPLRRYLRRQVGRPWDKVWSEIAGTLDNRSLGLGALALHAVDTALLPSGVRVDAQARRARLDGGPDTARAVQLPARDSEISPPIALQAVTRSHAGPRFPGRRAPV